MKKEFERSSGRASSLLSNYKEVKSPVAMRKKYLDSNLRISNTNYNSSIIENAENDCQKDVLELPPLL